MIVMKMYKHGSLYDLMKMEGPIKVPDDKYSLRLVTCLIRDIAFALSECHSRGIYHDDLKVGIALNIALLILFTTVARQCVH
jgi:serine/threonine protein kinase